MKKLPPIPNPFPALHPIAKDRWEGDCRIIQVKKIGEQYHVRVGSKDYPPKKTISDVQAIIDSVPRVEDAAFTPFPSDSLGRYANNSYTLTETTVNVPGRSRTSFF